MALELLMEYDPAPPFGAGAPKKAALDIVAGVRRITAGLQAERLAAARLTLRSS